MRKLGLLEAQTSAYAAVAPRLGGKCAVSFDLRFTGHIRQRRKKANSAGPSAGYFQAGLKRI